MALMKDERQFVLSPVLVGMF